MANLKSVGTTGSVNGITITKDNTKEILEGLDAAVEKVLTMIGIKAEKYAKALCPVGTVESTGKKGYRGGTLRNSITFEVETENDGGTVAIGSNVEYAPYVELGTGPYFTQPPDWETFQSTRGSGSSFGYVSARPYLRPAIESHLKEYATIIENELKS
jgi:phage gpG-like protein